MIRPGYRDRYRSRTVRLLANNLDGPGCQKTVGGTDRKHVTFIVGRRVCQNTCLG